jgi:hypothetical protein
VIKTKILAGLSHGCDEEAIRVVSLLKFAVPKTRKLKVQYHKTVHLHFRLPETPLPAATQISVTYELAPQRPAQPKTQDAVIKSPSYNYQLPID